LAVENRPRRTVCIRRSKDEEGCNDPLKRGLFPRETKETGKTIGAGATKRTENIIETGETKETEEMKEAAE